MRNLLAAATTAVFSLTAAPASAAGLDLVFDFVTGGDTVNYDGNGPVTTQSFTSRQQDLLTTAGNFWESVITGFSGATPDISIAIEIALAPIDGFRRGLAFAGPRGRELQVGVNQTTGLQQTFVRASNAIVQFDTADYGFSGFDEQEFLDVAIHELGHTLGFGTLFTNNGLVDPNDGTSYIGTEAVAEFNAITGENVKSILLDDIGGHWNECFLENLRNPDCSDDPTDGRPNFNNDPELLTTFDADGDATLSPITLGAMRDLGFTTSSTASLTLPRASAVSAVPLPAGGAMLLFGLAGFGFMRRRQA